MQGSSEWERAREEAPRMGAGDRARRTGGRHRRRAGAALCAYAVKLTGTPSAMDEADVSSLRAVGLDDVAIHDAIQVIAYFNYINRVADAVDVELEPEYPPRPR